MCLCLTVCLTVSVSVSVSVSDRYGQGVMIPLILKNNCAEKSPMALIHNNRVRDVCMSASLCLCLSCLSNQTEQIQSVKYIQSDDPGRLCLHSRDHWYNPTLHKITPSHPTLLSDSSTSPL